MDTAILEDEILLLESMYSGEFEVERCDARTSPSAKTPSQTVFTMTICPSTCGDVTLQNISVVLKLILGPDYPTDPPRIRLHKPRGISDLQLAGVLQDLHEEAEKRKGSPMIYDLIDFLKEHLTQSNFPTVECPFCLCNIVEGDAFFKTECFHYYHLFCLRRFVEFLSKQKEENSELDGTFNSCIVCRTTFDNPVVVDRKTVLEEPRSMAEVPEECDLLELSRKGQEWRKEIYAQQKQKRGIIRPETGEKMVVRLNHIYHVDDYRGVELPVEIPQLEEGNSSAGYPVDASSAEMAALNL